MPYKSLLITLSLLLALTGCQEKSNDQTKQAVQVEQQTKAEPTHTVESNQSKNISQPNTQLAHMGVTSEDGKITIDLNKSKSYFRQMAEQMKVHAEKFTQDMKKGMIDDKEAGIEVNQTHINIDINKTKSFLNNWSKKFEVYAKEIEAMMQELNTTTSN